MDHLPLHRAYTAISASLLVLLTALSQLQAQVSDIYTAKTLSVLERREIESEIARRALGYQAALESGDFDRIASFYDPQDQEDIRIHLVPVMHLFAEHPDSFRRDLAAIFFEDLSLEARKNPSNLQSTAGFIRFSISINPDFKGNFKNGKWTLVNIELLGNTTDQATVTYNLEVAGKRGSSAGTFRRTGNIWYTRPPTSIRTLAEKLRAELSKN